MNDKNIQDNGNSNTNTKHNIHIITTLKLHKSQKYIILSYHYNFNLYTTSNHNTNTKSSKNHSKSFKLLSKFEVANYAHNVINNDINTNFHIFVKGLKSKIKELSLEMPEDKYELGYFNNYKFKYINNDSNVCKDSKDSNDSNDSNTALIKLKQNDNKKLKTNSKGKVDKDINKEIKENKDIANKVYKISFNSLIPKNAIKFINVGIKDWYNNKFGYNKENIVTNSVTNTELLQKLLLKSSSTTTIRKSAIKSTKSVKKWSSNNSGSQYPTSFSSYHNRPSTTSTTTHHTTTVIHTYPHNYGYHNGYNSNYK